MMAEFCEVMRQAKRMCESYGAECGPCVLHERYGLCPLCAQTDDHIPADWKLDKMLVVEHFVMDWAVAHPEPRYPSWNAVWNLLFPDAIENHPPCPRYFIGGKRIDGYCIGKCAECKKLPIPADIAEKLGIKPIGGAIDA